MNRKKSLQRIRMHLGSLATAILAALLFPSGNTLANAQPAQPVEPKPASGAHRNVSFSSGNWNLADDTEIVSFGGRNALTGTAYLKDVSFLNGTLETDMWTTGDVSFAGFAFRIQSFEELEWLWLRMHRTNGLSSDAIQYAPAYRGVFCWQLYPDENGPANVPKNQWVHLKLTVLNNSASLYIGDMAKPVMTVDRLRLGLKPGSVGIKSSRKGSVSFSNFSYQVDDTSAVVVPKQAPIPRNVLAEWQLSPSSYPIEKVDDVPTVYPAARLANIEQWITPEVEGTGLVNLSRYHGTKYQSRWVGVQGTPEYVILRTFIDADRAKRVRMNFGYSDAATIFLNQVPLYSGNSAFLSRNKVYAGWISFNDAVFLDLKKGRNELLAVVAEDFGGSGFQAKLDDIDGITVNSGDTGSRSSVVLTVSNK